MIGVHKTFSSICNGVEKVLYWLIFIMFVSLIFTVFMQIVARYLFTQPWMWTVDIAQLLLVWTTLIGAAIGVRHKSHFVIDLFPTHWRLILTVTTWLTILILSIVSLVYLFQGWFYAIENINRTAGMVNISQFYFLASIPIGSALMLLFSTELILEEFIDEGKRRLTQ